MFLDSKIVKAMGACTEGAAYFKANFPKGGTYEAVQAQLHTEGRFDWSHWLVSAAFKHATQTPEVIGPLVQSEVALAIQQTKDSPNSSSGYNSKAASSGDYSKAASSGNGSTAASSGDYSKAASSGNGSTAASSGYNSTAASSGDYSKAASSGDYSKAASSGYNSKAASSGDYSTAASSGNGSTAAMVCGRHGKASAAEGGCIVLLWFDGKRERAVVGYVGEDGVKADTLYTVNKAGKLVEV